MLMMETLGAVTWHLQGWEQPMLPAQLIYQEAHCTFTTVPRRSRAQETRDRRADAPAPSAHQGELGSFLNKEEEVGGLEPIRLTPATREGRHSLVWIPPSRAGSLPPGPPASGPRSQHGERSVSCLTKELLGDLRGSLTASLLPPLLSAFGTPSTCWASTRATPDCTDGLPPVSRPRNPLCLPSQQRREALAVGLGYLRAGWRGEHDDCAPPEAWLVGPKQTEEAGYATETEATYREELCVRVGGKPGRWALPSQPSVCLPGAQSPCCLEPEAALVCPPHAPGSALKEGGAGSPGPCPTPPACADAPQTTA